MACARRMVRSTRLRQQIIPRTTGLLRTFWVLRRAEQRWAVKALGGPKFDIYCHKYGYVSEGHNCISKSNLEQRRGDRAVSRWTRLGHRQSVTHVGIVPERHGRRLPFTFQPAPSEPSNYFRIMCRRRFSPFVAWTPRTEWPFVRYASC